MKNYKCFLLLGMIMGLLGDSLQLFSQSSKFNLEYTTFSAASGKVASSPFELNFTASQNSPIVRGESENFSLSSGIIAIVGGWQAAALITAQVNCAATIPDSCPVMTTLSVIADSSLGEKIGSFTGRLIWDSTLLKYSSDSGLLSGFTGLVNTDSVDAGVLHFNGANPSGADSNIAILQVNFNEIAAVDTAGALNIGFSALAAAGSFRNLLPFLSVKNCGYEIVEADALGDVNGDGRVNSTDALILLSFDVGFNIPAAFLERINRGVGDVNRDGMTNSTDALIILSFDVEIAVPFPVGEPHCP